MPDEGFDHELQEVPSFFSSDMHKFNSEAQLKTLTHIIHEKQVGIKDAITLIPSLISQNLLVPELLNLVKLILIVPITNAVSEKLR